MRRGCNDCTVGPASPFSCEVSGDEVLAGILTALRFDSPDDGRRHEQIVGALRAEPPVSDIGLAALL